MVRQYELVDQVLEYDRHADVAALDQAYVFAMTAHGGQTRKSGDPYFSHAVAVASILADYRLDTPTIVSALLHDVVEDTTISVADVREKFGDQVAHIVDGVTKLSVAQEQAENRRSASFRKLLIALARDPRVLFIKLADRLHNMRTIHHMPAEAQKRIAQETLDIYGPLAGRIGMQAIRDELEDLAFRTVNPEAAHQIDKQLDEIFGSSTEMVSVTTARIEELMHRFVIKVDVSGRRKSPYSIWRKMAQRDVQMDRLADIFGFRVLTEDTADCYRALGALHSSWNYVPGTFKDYISAPKENGYQSLHTKLIGPDKNRIEVQMRTRAMHEVAEYGVAAHDSYKQMAYSNGAAEQPAESGESGENSAEKHGITTDSADKYNDNEVYASLQRMVQALADGTPAEDVLENAKLELFVDQIFVFTPRGRMICLPRGATVIDFAYAVHTDLGNSCTGCKVNGHLVAVSNLLANGDEVEIIRSEGVVPPAAWETIAVTGRARTAIRRANRRDEVSSMRDVGAKMLGEAIKIAKHDQRIDKDFVLLNRVKELKFQTVDDLYERVGRGQLTTNEVLDIEGKTPASGSWWRSASSLGWLKRSVRSSSKGNGRISHGGGVPAIVVGAETSSAAFVLSSQGCAVPGDEIVGVRRDDGLIEVYHAKSSVLASMLAQKASALKQGQSQPVVDPRIVLKWRDNLPLRARYSASVKVELRNEPGCLAEVLTCLGNFNVNVSDLKMTLREPKIYRVEIDIEVIDADQLKEIIETIRRLEPVTRAHRYIH